MLEGVRVLDLCDESGALAGRILGDLGADVIAIEPPGGRSELRRPPYLRGHADPERSLAWLTLQTSKRGIVLDLMSEAGRARYRALLATVDVVLETFRPGVLASLGLDPADLAAAHPRLVHCSITPFGLTGPYADFVGGDLVCVAMGGNLGMTGEPDRPPVRCSMPTAYYHAGPEAVIGVLAALYQREETGRGQLVDVSLHETQLQTLLGGAGQRSGGAPLPRRAGARLGNTREIWPAEDGMVSFGLRGGASRIGSLRATVDYMAECRMAPDWLRTYDWEHYTPLEASADEIARLEAAFGAFFASKTMRELYSEALARRILLAPCNDARELLGHEQLRARGLFRAVDYSELGATIEQPDFFAVVSPRPVSIRRRAPRLGEHDAEIDRELAAAPAPAAAPETSPPTPASGSGDVFRGLHVLEVGSGAAGPVATKYLAEHGARVIRIESAKRPDFLRVLFLTKDSRFGPDGSSMFVLLNPNKDSLTLNLKHPEARALAERLVVWADVLCENYAPGVMEKLGLGAERVRAINPEIVMASGCLFGQTGPQRHYPGFGGQGSAISGFNHLTGWPDGPAHGPFATITDSLSPRYVAVAILAALWRRRRSGEGATIDLSQIETAVYSLSEVVARYSANGEIAARRGNRDEWSAPSGVYPCGGEERWIAISARRPSNWEALVRALGTPDWAQDPRFESPASRLANEDALDAALADSTRDHEPYALMETLQAAGVEAGVVQSFDDVLADPQLAHRNHWVRLRHIHLGEMCFDRSGFRLSGGSGGLSRPGPNLGEHNHAILSGVLGLDAAEIERLIAEEAVA